MKKLIRHNVWETNSSSSHSISIADDNKEFVLDYIYPDQNGVITLDGGEFGWEWFKHNDALTKANYVAASYGLIEALKEAIIEQTGASDVIYRGSSDYDSNWSYVDHDSYGVAPSTKEDIKKFIFNKNSWLFGGNDNSEADPTFYDVPEFKDGKQILPIYKYILKIDGFKRTTKFKEYPNEEMIRDGLSSLLSRVYLHENGYFDDDDSVYAQLNRNTQNCYQYSSWKKPIDFENKIIYFIKEGWNEARKRWEIDFPNEDWQGPNGFQKCRQIEEALYTEPNSKFIKEIKFEIEEI